MPVEGSLHTELKQSGVIPRLVGFLCVEDFPKLHVRINK